MKTKAFIACFFCLFTTLVLQAQKSNKNIERFIIDTFYIASKDDTISFENGEVQSLPLGAITYRIYVDLLDNVELLKVYGDESHPIRISSTDTIYNHSIWGENYGFDLKNGKFDENVTFLDSWLTMGFASSTHYGVLKEDDNDGALDAIVYNLDDALQNDIPLMGIPLAAADGLLPAKNFSKSDLIGAGLGEISNQIVFQDHSVSTNFLSDNFFIKCDHGVKFVPYSDRNIVLLAQITTKGKISFSFNLSVMTPDGNEINYCGSDSLLAENEQYNPWLTYPFNLERLYGCTDAAFIEYSSEAVYDNGTCKDSVIFGCLDPLACNYGYTPGANKNIPSLCCYNSECALDLGIVCPGTVYGCTDPLSVNYNPLANKESDIDNCSNCKKSGCLDINYKEYDRSSCYHIDSLCKTRIIEGCMDKKALNFNPIANASGKCEYDSLNTFPQTKSSIDNSLSLFIYPNPTKESINFIFYCEEIAAIKIKIFDNMGNEVYNKFLGSVKGNYTSLINISDMREGMYSFVLFKNEIPESINFLIKRK